MSVLHYGLIGCGVIGPTHAQALSQLPDARLVGVCDIDQIRAERLADRHKVPFITSDYRKLIARPDIDAICICTPHHLHAEMALEALHAKKHVFCEKPMAIRPVDMDAMVAMADGSGVQLGICFQHRFDPVMVQLRQLIDEGRLGRLLVGGAHCRCLRNAQYYASETWRGTWNGEGGGVLINQAIHTIDLLLWLFGTARMITGTYGTLRWQDEIEVEDTATGVLVFNSGAQGHIVATTASHLDWSTRLHVFGTEGSAVVNTGGPNEFTFLELLGEPFEQEPEDDAYAEVAKSCYGNSHIRALEAFTAAVLHDTPYPIDGREGRRAVEAVLGLYQAAREGGPVMLPLTADPVLR